MEDEIVSGGMAHCLSATCKCEKLIIVEVNELYNMFKCVDCGTLFAEEN